MTLQTDLEAAVARVLADSQILRTIVNGPAAGDASLVSVETGIVKTVARALAEIGDVTNQAIKDLGNVLDADFAAKAIAAGVGGDLRGADNLAGLADPASARGHLGLGSAAVEDADAFEAADAAIVKSDTDKALAAGYDQEPTDLGSLDAMADDTLALAGTAGNNRFDLTVDVDGEIDAAGLPRPVEITATNSGARSLTIGGGTQTANSADFDGTAGAVNIILFRKDSAGTVDYTIDQRGT